MKMIDNGTKVSLVLTYRQAEKLWVLLNDVIWNIPLPKKDIKILTDMSEYLDEYINS